MTLMTASRILCWATFLSIAFAPDTSAATKMKPVCNDASKPVWRQSIAAFLPGYKSAAAFLRQASCFGRPGKSVGIVVNGTASVVCGTESEILEFRRRDESFGFDLFTPPREWSPVPPECFHSNCPMGKFEYPAGCDADGDFSDCIFSGRWYFAMNVLDVFLKIARPPSGDWNDAAVFNRIGHNSWALLTLNITVDGAFWEMMTKFGFSAFDNEVRVSLEPTEMSNYYKSDMREPQSINGTFRTIRNRYFMPVRPANSTIAPNSSYCAELSFPLGGYVSENATANELPTWPTICIHECPLGSAYLEADKPLKVPSSSSSPPKNRSSVMDEAL